MRAKVGADCEPTLASVLKYLTAASFHNEHAAPLKGLTVVEGLLRRRLRYRGELEGDEPPLPLLLHVHPRVTVVAELDGLRAGLAKMTDGELSELLRRHEVMA